MLLKPFTLLLCLSSLMGCGIFNGTNTGNPLAQGALPDTDSPLLYTNKLNGHICLTIKYCESSVNIQNCMSSNDTNLHIPVELNIDSNYPTLDLLRKAESLKKILVNENSAASCFSSIQQISCSSTEMQNAYNSSDPNNFENTFQLLRVNSECGNIFVPL